jgi:hypothetical protein
MTKEIKVLHKQIAEHQQTIDRQRIVIKQQQDTLEFILTGKPIWKLLLI